MMLMFDAVVCIIFMLTVASNVFRIKKLEHTIVDLTTALVEQREEDQRRSGDGGADAQGCVEQLAAHLAPPASPLASPSSRLSTGSTPTTRRS